MTKRLLFIAHRVPFPPDKGERVRAFHEIRALGPRFHITLAALAHAPADEAAAEGLRPWCPEIRTARAGGARGLLRGAATLLAGRSVTEGYFAGPGLLAALQEEARRHPFDLVFAYCSSVLPLALAVPAAAHVADLVDVDSAKWAAYAQAAAWPKRWLYGRESRGVAALEARALAQCDAVLVVSAAEAQALGPRSDKVLAVSNGVDTEFFRPPETGPAGPPRLVFTGTMDYRPNVEGVCRFVREVWPALKRQAPALALDVVGRDPAPEVVRLGRTPGVTVTGTVPDVRPYLAAATAAIVPLDLARGIQNKILEAMAMGRPVVASAAALEGLDVAVGTEVLRADSAPQWERSILDLLANPDRRSALGRAARARVVADYGWDARLAPLVALCARLAGATAPEAAADGGSQRR